MDTGRGYMSGLDLLSVNCPGGQCNRAWSYQSLNVVMLIVQINYKSISSQGIVKSSPPTKKKPEEWFSQFSKTIIQLSKVIHVMDEEAKFFMVSCSSYSLT